jgi:hypothetical protein
MPKKQNTKAERTAKREYQDSDLVYLSVPDMPCWVLRKLSQMARSERRGSRANYVRHILEQHVGEFEAGSDNEVAMQA